MVQTALMDHVRQLCSGQDKTSHHTIITDFNRMIGMIVELKIDEVTTNG